MIMGSHWPREIGRRYVGLTDHESKSFPNQPLLILREATRDEYLADLTRQAISVPPDWPPSGSYFYEVSVD